MKFIDTHLEAGKGQSRNRRIVSRIVMRTVVVGGHSRNVGKTAVVASLIQNLPEYSWTAMKISAHWHERVFPPGRGHPDDICNIYEESEGGGSSDTARFLDAGASRSFWIHVKKGGLEASMPRLLPILNASPAVIIESNSILRFVQPDLYIIVLKYDIKDFKPSARESIEKAHAAVVINCGAARPEWGDVSLAALQRIPVFTAKDLQSIPENLADFVRSRL